ncbi:RHS repeat protein [Paenibacillus spiritus]|uniref:RHS repeat protein n=1 Tax=Paenibacillus spiritus TaxID=2496557 RepID=A0A5J5FRH9_9BACL|nr:RHS repeat protein [Paenibacillus spiritus]
MNTTGGKTIQYEYDNAGNRTKMTDPFGAITLYAYDDDNRLTKVSFKANASAGGKYAGHLRILWQCA